MRVRSSLWVVLLLLAAGLEPARADAWGDARNAFLKAQKSDKWQDRVTGFAQLAGEDSAEAVTLVLGALAREGNAAVRTAAVRTLAAYASKGAIEALEKVVRAGKDPARLYVLLALAEQPGPSSKDLLIETLAAKDPAAAAQAALALGKKQVPEARPHLLALLQQKDGRLRAAGARGLRLLAGQAPGSVPGKPQAPAPAPLRTPEVLNALVDALDGAEGRERTDVIAALARLSGGDYGWDVPAWRAAASGTPAADIGRNPRLPATFFGVPVHGRRVVILVDTNVRTDDPHPFAETERLKELLKVPGARPIPWAGVRKIKEFLAAHVKRCLADLPAGTLFDLVMVGAKPHPAFGRLTPLNDGTRAQAIALLEGSKPEAGNDVLTALEGALDISGRADGVAWSLGPDELLYANVSIPWLAKEPENNDVLVVGPTISMKARLRMVPITTVGVSDHPHDLLSGLADATGGTYVALTQ